MSDITESTSTTERRGSPGRMGLLRSWATTLFVIGVGFACSPTLAQTSAAPHPRSEHVASALGAADEDGDDEDNGDDEAPSPCLPGYAPSAITGRCVDDFPEHLCPDGGMSIWNRCPRGVTEDPEQLTSFTARRRDAVAGSGPGTAGSSVAEPFSSHISG